MALQQKVDGNVGVRHQLEMLGGNGGESGPPTLGGAAQGSPLAQAPAKILNAHKMIGRPRGAAHSRVSAQTGDGSTDRPSHRPAFPWPAQRPLGCPQLCCHNPGGR